MIPKHPDRMLVKLGRGCFMPPLAAEPWDGCWVIGQVYWEGSWGALAITAEGRYVRLEQGLRLPLETAQVRQAIRHAQERRDFVGWKLLPRF